MIREIQYVCSANIDYFTCHALFSKITDLSLRKLNVSAYSKQPQYSISFSDRVIKVIVNTGDITLLPNLPHSLEFNHKGKVVTAVLFKDEEFQKKSDFVQGDMLFASGVISYARTLTKPQTIPADKSWSGVETVKKHQSVITAMGNFHENEKKSTLDYLESRLGLDLQNSQIDHRDFRFEMISYKHFESNQKVLSKTNGNALSLHNIFYFAVQGFVKDLSIVNSLEFTSIGRKRSYGFGNIEVKRY